MEEKPHEDRGGEVKVAHSNNKVKVMVLKLQGLLIKVVNKMTLGLYLQIFLILQTTVTQGEDTCSIVYDDSKNCFFKELLILIDHSANQLGVDKKKNVLYFSLDSSRGKFTPAALDIDTKRLTLLDGVKDALAVAVDEESGDVYFGGSKGIYKFIGADKKVQRLHLKQVVRWLILRGYIYYIQLADSKAYVYRLFNIKRFRQVQNITMNQFVFDAERNVFFINKTGLYRVSRYHDTVRLVRKSSKFFGMTTNNEGKVYVSSDDGIYYIKGGLKLEKYLDIPSVVAMAFDKFNNLIYSDSRQLVRLLPMSNKNGIKTSNVNNIILV